MTVHIGSENLDLNHHGKMRGSLIISKLIIRDGDEVDFGGKNGIRYRKRKQWDDTSIQGFACYYQLMLIAYMYVSEISFCKCHKTRFAIPCF
jgi:hypothetical protein